MKIYYYFSLVSTCIDSFWSISFLIAKGTFSIFPSTTGLIKFNPWSSRMLSPLGDKINVAKEVAPARFLTVLGIVNEKYIGSPKTVWPLPSSKVYEAVLFHLQMYLNDLVFYMHKRRLLHTIWEWPASNLRGQFRTSPNMLSLYVYACSTFFLKFDYSLRMDNDVISTLASVINSPLPFMILVTAVTAVTAVTIANDTILGFCTLSTINYS